MGAAFSIQVFFIPVLKKNPNPRKYTFYTMLAYIFGMITYYYIAYVGSVGTFDKIKEFGRGTTLSITEVNRRLRVILDLIVGR